MRVLLWHGWLLEGSGSNVYTARTAEALRTAGHDVVLLCQEPNAARYGFVDAVGAVGADGPEALRETGAAPSAGGGRCVVLRPRIGPLLPVFVVDAYEGFDRVERFVDLTDDELAVYLDRNVAALRAAVAWHRPDAVVAGHAIPGGTVAARAPADCGFVVKVHGSDIEYAARLQPRLADLTREGLRAAATVVGGSRDVLARAVALAPSIGSRLRVVPPGVDVEAFRPRPRAEALEAVARLLERDEQGGGRPADVDLEIRRAVERRDRAPLTALAGRYDQAQPDPSAPQTLRRLAGVAGPLVGYLGKLIPQKGVDLFLQGLALASARPSGLVVGFGSAREELEALLSALDQGDGEGAAALSDRLELTPDEAAGASGLRERVSFTGRLDHRYAPFALAAMDVLVVPSVVEEAFGMVAAEGAACGALPLVARHSGLAEVAEALETEVGRPGLFSFDPGPGASRGIAAGLDRLLGLPGPERDRLRDAVSAFVAREWTWDRTARRLLEAATEPHGGARRQAVQPDATT